MKKIALGLFVVYSCYASMPWETSWAMGGTSTYSIIDNSNNQLLLECNDMNKSIYLRDEKRSNFKFSKTIRMKLDDKEMNVLTGVNDETVTSDQLSWNDFIYNLSKSKNISIFANNKEYIFEPNNINKIQDIKETCTINNSEKEQTQNVQQASFPNKQPFKLDLKREYNEIYKMAYPMLVITSLDDKLVIKDIKVNKGKCNAIPLSEVKQNINGRVIVNIDRAKLPVSVLEYEALKVNITSGCNVLRLDIDTNSGSWTFGEN